MSGDAWGCLTLIVLIIAIFAYFAYERWLEHQEFMAGKRDPADEDAQDG